MLRQLGEPQEGESVETSSHQCKEIKMYRLTGKAPHGAWVQLVSYKGLPQLSSTNPTFKSTILVISYKVLIQLYTINPTFKFTIFQEFRNDILKRIISHLHYFIISHHTFLFHHTFYLIYFSLF